MRPDGQLSPPPKPRSLSSPAFPLLRVCVAVQGEESERGKERERERERETHEHLTGSELEKRICHFFNKMKRIKICLQRIGAISLNRTYTTCTVILGEKKRRETQMDVTEKQKEKNDNWALFEAIESRDLGTLESLLRKGVSPNVQVVNRDFLREKICE